MEGKGKGRRQSRLKIEIGVLALVLIDHVHWILDIAGVAECFWFIIWYLEFGRAFYVLSFGFVNN